MGWTPEELAAMAEADAEIERDFRITREERELARDIDRQAKDPRLVRNAQKARERYWKNPEKYRARDRERYWANREKILARQRARYHARKEAERAEMDAGGAGRDG